jgi:hypothetical protein
MQKVLNEIADLPGVVGSCLFNREKGKMCSGLPSAFSDETVQIIATHTSRIVQMGKMVDMDIQSISLRYNTYSVVTMPVDTETVLLTACVSQANTSLVTTTLSVLSDELKNDLEPKNDVDPEAAVPIEPLLAQMRESLAFVIGPMADMIFDDHLDAWMKTGYAAPSRLSELVEMIVTELDEDSVDEFRRKVRRICLLMNIPPKTKRQWADIVTGKKTYDLKFLAAKFLLNRVVSAVKSNPTQESIRDGVNQLHDLFEKNSASPSVQADLKAIFG